MRPIPVPITYESRESRDLSLTISLAPFVVSYKINKLLLSLSLSASYSQSARTYRVLPPFIPGPLRRDSPPLSRFFLARPCRSSERKTNRRSHDKACTGHTSGLLAARIKERHPCGIPTYPCCGLNYSRGNRERFFARDLVGGAREKTSARHEIERCLFFRKFQERRSCDPQRTLCSKHAKPTG